MQLQCHASSRVWAFCQQQAMCIVFGTLFTTFAMWPQAEDWKTNTIIYIELSQLCVILIMDSWIYWELFPGWWKECTQVRGPKNGKHMAGQRWKNHRSPNRKNMAGPCFFDFHPFCSFGFDPTMFSAFWPTLSLGKGARDIILFVFQLPCISTSHCLHLIYFHVACSFNKIWLCFCSFVPKIGGYPLAV